MKKIIKLTEKDLTRLVKRVVNENLSDRADEMYSHINELINMEYNDVESEDQIDVLENILQGLKSTSYRNKKGRGHITKDQVMKRWSMNESAQADDDVVVNVEDISQEDMKCFSDVSTADAKKVGLNHGGKYKVKKRGCMTKTRYKGPKQKYYGNNQF
jgi:hypothetical protein